MRSDGITSPEDAIRADGLSDRDPAFGAALTASGRTGTSLLALLALALERHSKELPRADPSAEMTFSPHTIIR